MYLINSTEIKLPRYICGEPSQSAERIGIETASMWTGDVYVGVTPPILAINPMLQLPTDYWRFSNWKTPPSKTSWPISQRTKTDIRRLLTGSARHLPENVPKTHTWEIALAIGTVNSGNSFNLKIIRHSGPHGSESVQFCAGRNSDRTTLPSYEIKTTGRKETEEETTQRLTQLGLIHKLERDGKILDALFLAVSGNFLDRAQVHVNVLRKNHDRRLRVQAYSAIETCMEERVYEYVANGGFYYKFMLPLETMRLALYSSTH